MEKLFVYLGEDPALKREYEMYGDKINEAYAALLTHDQQARLLGANSKLLTPGSFFHNRNDVMKRTGDYLEPDHSNHLGIKPGVDDNNPSINYIAHYFFVSAESFKHSSSSQFTDKNIASYVHEYDHHILIALQKIPMACINIAFQEFLEPRKLPFDFADYAAQLKTMPLTHAARVDRLGLAISDIILMDSFEKATRIMDRRVLGSIGVNVPLDFRNKPRKYQLLNLDKEDGEREKIMVYPDLNTDPFIGKSERDVIEMVANWERYLKFPVSSTRTALDFVEQVKRAKYIKMSLDAFLEKARLDEEIKRIEESGSGI